MKPRARSRGLVVRHFADESVVYDTDSHRAHCLNRTAAFVFHHADGQRTVSAIARLLAPREAEGEDLVREALARLSEAGLMEVAGTGAGAGRREVLRGVAASACVAAPLVASLLVPTPAEASATCIEYTSCSSSNLFQPCYVSNPATECATYVCQGPSACSP